MTRKAALTGIAALALAGAGCLVPAQAAHAVVGPETYIIYYSSAAHTTAVGEYEFGACGRSLWGSETSYIVEYEVECNSA
jgi:hypothetical protein